MAQQAATPFTGFSLGMLPKQESEGGVLILVVHCDGNLTAAAHATERGAMEAAVDYVEGEGDDDDGEGALEAQFARAQRLIADDGGLLEIVASPVFGE